MKHVRRKTSGKTVQELLLFLLTAVLICGCTVFAQNVSAYVRVDDMADLLSSEEELNLRAQALELEASTGYDFFLITTDDSEGLEAREYAETYYMEYHTTLDGAVYLIDMDNRELYIATSGDMRYYLTDERIETMLDHAYDYVVDGQYAGAFRSLLSDTGRYLQSGIEAGTYTKDEETGEVQYYQEPAQITFWEFLLGLTVAVIAGSAFFGITVGRYKLRFGHYAYSYQDNSRLNLRRKNDRIVNKIVTQRRIPRSDPPSHSGGGGGGGHVSTVHTGAGGNSFGGGGRKF